MPAACWAGAGCRLPAFAWFRDRAAGDAGRRAFRVVRRWAGGVIIGGVGTSADAGDTRTGPGHGPYLPEPTGPCPVGTTSLYLRDASRSDPWAAGVSARELMVSLWYPATPSAGPRAWYMTPAESRLLLASRGLTSVPQDTLSTVRTNAVSDATPAGRQRASLVVLSPGFTAPRSTLTALAEDQASHGYVVARVDHTYESDATAFPDGRVTTCLAREAPRSGRAEKLGAGRAADVSFVLGELTAAHPALAGRPRYSTRPGWRWLATPPAAQPSSPPCWPTPASGPASTWTVPLTPRSPTTACHGRFCSWASSPTTPWEAEGVSPGNQAPRAPGSVTGNS